MINGLAHMHNSKKHIGVKMQINHIKEWVKIKIKYIKKAAKLWLFLPYRLRYELLHSEFEMPSDILIVFCFVFSFLLLWLFPFPVIPILALCLEHQDKKEGI